MNQRENRRELLPSVPVGRVCLVVVQIGLLLVLNGFFEVGHSQTEENPSLNSVQINQPYYSAQQGFAISDGISNQSAKPSPSLQREKSDEGLEEVVYLAVYLNTRILTEVMEAKEKNGTVYFKLQDIAILVGSKPVQGEKTYATSEELERIYPAKFEFSRKLQALLIRGTGKLPIEERWARERRQKMLLNNDITEDSPIINFDYGLLGRPSFDFSASYFKNGHERFNYSFKGGMEALYGTAYLFGRGLKDDNLTDLRLTWERFNRNWFIQMGDVVAPQVDLVAQADVGRGVVFSTFPIENATQFDSETIVGDLLDGWEVELYRGNTLLDFRKSDGSGRFIFRNIPLLFGDNNIILKFYGPQGQVRQETRQVNIGRSMAPEGKLWTRFNFIDQGKNLFLGRNSQTRNHIEGIRGFGEVFYGLSSRLTLTASATSFTSTTLDRRTLGKLGFQTSYFGSSLKMDFLTDDEGGWGLESSFLRTIMGWGVQYNHVEFFDLITDSEPNLKTRRTLRINKGFGNIFFELSAQQRVDSFNVTRYRYRNRLSGSIGRFRATHDIDANFGGGNEFSRGNFLLNGRINPNLFLRTNVNYDVHPKVEVRNIQATLDYRPFKYLTSRSNVLKNMIDKRDYVFSQSLLWQGEKVGLGLTYSYSTDEEFQITASVTFSMSPALNGGYEVSRNPSTNLGTVNVRVFLDHDQDGEYDHEIDEVLESIGLQNQSELSSKHGMIAMKGPAYRLARIKINENTLPDPFMVVPPAVAVRPRPTHINTYNIPVWETGEIEGQSSPGEMVELIENGQVIATTRAEFDGFFLFEKVRFKNYEVRAQGQSQNVVVSREHPIARVKWKGSL